MVSGFLSSDEQTRAAGAALASVLMQLAPNAPDGVTVFLSGPLGAGKSTFARGFLSAVGITGIIPSPTYSLVETYQSGKVTVMHMDAYRLGDAAELDYLGLDEAFGVGKILLIEWPENIEESLPPPLVRVCLEHTPVLARAGVDAPGRRIGVSFDEQLSRQYPELMEKYYAVHSQIST